MGKVFTENGVMIDLDELRKVVAECDVFAIGFRLFPQRLIVDTRTSDEVGPMAELVEPANSVEERFFWLGRRRPSFPVPERFTFFVWPHSIALLVECGVADNIRQRLVASERPDMAETVDQALIGLERLERSAIQDAVIGKNYHTLWQRD